MTYKQACAAAFLTVGADSMFFNVCVKAKATTRRLARERLMRQLLKLDLRLSELPDLPTVRPLWKSVASKSAPPRSLL